MNDKCDTKYLKYIEGCGCGVEKGWKMWEIRDTNLVIDDMVEELMKDIAVIQSNKKNSEFSKHSLDFLLTFDECGLRELAEGKIWWSKEKILWSYKYCLLWHNE